MQLWKKQKQQHGPKNQSHSASVWSRWRAGLVGWMRCQQGKLYSDLILCTANQILGPAHPPSLKFRRSGQPRNGIESTSHWKSFVPLSKRGGGHTASWTLLNSCTGIDQSISCVFNVCETQHPWELLQKNNNNTQVLQIWWQGFTSLWCVRSTDVPWGQGSKQLQSF